jgi:uncharacterized protein YcfJ
VKRTIATVVLCGVAAIALAGCATTPLGPTVPVMPAQNKPFEAFAQDQTICKQYADQQVNGQAEVANNQAVGGAILTTVLGAGLGAAVGGGPGAAIGAASGAVVGSAGGANASGWRQGGIQRQYDIAYAQCMAAKGNQVPGMGGGGPPRGYAAARPPMPPPGYYPPPPPYYYGSPYPPPPYGY